MTGKCHAVGYYSHTKRCAAYKQTESEIHLPIINIVLSVSCSALIKKEHTTEWNNPVKVEIDSQIGQFVTNIFEDSKGHLWFGTIEKGIAKYDGKTLKYFSQKDGLPSNRITGVRSSESIDYIHRKTEDADIYFVINS